MTPADPPPKQQANLSDVKALGKAQSFAGLWRKARALAVRRKPAYVFGELMVGALTFASTLPDAVSVEKIGERVRDVSDKMFGFTATILGIVIAGFAIISTVSQASFVTTLVRRRPGAELLPVERIALHFVAAFIPYLAFLAYYVLSVCIGWLGGPVTLIANALGPTVGKLVGGLVFGVLGWGCARLLVALAALIVNTYASFMVLVAAKVADTEGAIVDDTPRDGVAPASAPEATKSPAAPTTPPKARVADSTGAEAVLVDHAAHSDESDEPEPSETLKTTARRAVR